MSGYRRFRKSSGAGLIISGWPSFRENWMNWMAGSGIACETVSGTIGRKESGKRKSLIRLGVKPRDAFRWSRSILGGWAISQSPILNTTIIVELLCKRGYESMLKWYHIFSPHKYTPTLFPIVWWTAWYVAHTSGGRRGFSVSYCWRGCLRL